MRQFCYLRTRIVGSGFLGISVIGPIFNQYNPPFFSRAIPSVRSGCSKPSTMLGPTLGGSTVDVLGDQYRWLFIFSAPFLALAWLAMGRMRNDGAEMTAL